MAYRRILGPTQLRRAFEADCRDRGHQGPLCPTCSAELQRAIEHNQRLFLEEFGYPMPPD